MKTILKRLSYCSLIAFFTFLLTSLQLNAKTHFNFDFSEGTQGWTGDFADYPVGEEVFYELTSGWTNLPKTIPNSSGKGMMLAGNNHSDDLMMFIKKQISGLKPNTDYDIHFTVMIETNVAVGKLGAGGSPGESVFFKVGASSKEPTKLIVGKYYRPSIDVGIQGADGSEGIVIGNLANPAVDFENPTFEPKEMSTVQGIRANSDKHGKLWLFIGTDSGFETYSKYYIANIAIQFNLIEFSE